MIVPSKTTPCRPLLEQEARIYADIEAYWDRHRDETDWDAQEFSGFWEPTPTDDECPAEDEAFEPSPADDAFAATLSELDQRDADYELWLDWYEHHEPQRYTDEDLAAAGLPVG